MAIQLEYYRVFLTAAREGSVTKAAESLRLTQSAVSQTIQRLEEALGVSLFVRTSRGVSLTENGRALEERIGGLLDGVDGAERYFARLGRLEAGALRIGASDTLCRALLLPHLKAFRALHPAVMVQVTNRTSGETVSLLRRGQVDLGFVALPLEEEPELEKEFAVNRVLTLHDCFICGGPLLDEFPGPVDLAGLIRYPVLMLERLSAGRRWLDRQLAQRGIALRPEIELGSLDLLVEFARAGLGVAAVIRELIREEDGIRHISLTDPLPPRQAAMLWRRAVPPSAAVRAFADRLLEEPEAAAPLARL